MEKVILTLTTVPKRLHNPNESAGVKPGLEILLNLSYENYEVHFNIPLFNKKTGEQYFIPSWLKEMELKYEKLKVFRTDDYGPVTKLVPTLFRFDENDDITIISVEDDLFYMDGFIQYHLKMREKYPESILGFAGISSLNTTCHFCTTCKEDVKVRILESYKTISYKRRYFDNDFFTFVNENYSWSDDLLIAAYFSLKKRDRVVETHTLIPKIETHEEWSKIGGALTFPVINHTIHENYEGCNIFRQTNIDDNGSILYKFIDLGYQK
jgi:hypothetical protein